MEWRSSVWIFCPEMLPRGGPPDGVYLNCALLDLRREAGCCLRRCSCLFSRAASAKCLPRRLHAAAAAAISSSSPQPSPLPLVPNMRRRRESGRLSIFKVTLRRYFDCIYYARFHPHFGGGSGSLHPKFTYGRYPLLVAV